MEKDQPEDLETTGKITIKHILNMLTWKVWTEFIWVRIKTNDTLL